MKITYIHHSCFALEYQDSLIVIDYYKDSETNILKTQLLPKANRIYVLSTHSHADHFSKDVLSWKKDYKNITYILSQDILEDKMVNKADAFFLNKGDQYSDEILQIKTYGSTDKGISFYIEIGGYKIFHAGDLNNWHWNEESSAEYIKEAEDFYASELADVTKNIKCLDVAMYPIDYRLGKDFMKGAEAFISEISVKDIMPMHTQGNYEKAKLFSPIAKKHNCTFIPIDRENYSFKLD